VEVSVEVKVGVQHSPRELVLESAQSPEEVLAAVTKALGDGGLLTLTDEKGRQVMVPADKISYLDIGAAEQRRVGFGSAPR
jgi:hypothetical protein